MPSDKNTPKEARVGPCLKMLWFFSTFLLHWTSRREFFENGRNQYRAHIPLPCPINFALHMEEANKLILNILLYLTIKKSLQRFKTTCNGCIHCKSNLKLFLFDIFCKSNDFASFFKAKLCRRISLKILCQLFLPIFVDFGQEMWRAFLKFATTLVDLLSIGLSGHISHIWMGIVIQCISHIHYNCEHSNGKRRWRI